MSDKFIQGIQDILDGKNEPLASSVKEAHDNLHFALEAKGIYAEQLRDVELEIQSRGLTQEIERERVLDAQEIDAEVELEF